MLPLPRRRLDPDDVRVRLRALAGGTSASIPEPAPASFEDLLGPVTERVVADSVVVRPRTRAVALAVAATALAAWIVVHLTSGGAPSPVELAPGTPMTSASASGSPGSAGTQRGGSLVAPAPSATQLVVQVLGEVRRPGLVRLDPGARVADALRAAGGLVRGGGSGALNLARPVVDGEQIVVSHTAPAPAAVADTIGGSAPAGPLAVLDLNTATVSDLDTLPGVGPVMAGRILDWRAAHGRFASVDQLREISGIGARTFERLKPHVRV